VSLNGGQTAYFVDGVGCFLQVFWVGHIELLREVFDGEFELRALENRQSFLPLASMVLDVET
jgi:hypothetical protein